jgi:hypothetical protein
VRTWLLILMASLHLTGCSVMAVAGAAVTVVATTVSTGATVVETTVSTGAKVVETTVDVVATGVKAAVGRDED